MYTDLNRAVIESPHMEGVVEVAGAGAVDGQGGQVTEIASLGVGQQFLRRNFAQRRHRLEAGFGEIHRLIGAEQGQVLIRIPDSGLDQHLEAGVGRGEFSLLQHLTDELLLRAFAAKQHRLGQPMEDAVAVRPLLDRDRLPPGKPGHAFGRLVQQARLFLFPLALQSQLLDLLRAVHRDGAVTKLEVEWVGEHRAEKGGGLVIVHGRTEEQFG